MQIDALEICRQPIRRPGIVMRREQVRGWDTHVHSESENLCGSDGNGTLLPRRNHASLAVQAHGCGG